MSTSKDLYEMTDEEIMGMERPPEREVDLSVSEEQTQEEEIEEVVEEEADEDDSDTSDDDDTDKQSDDDVSEEEENPLSFDDDETPDAPPQAEEKKSGDVSEETPKELPDEKTGSEKSVKTAEKTAAVDYENFYNQIMKPFKANGKDIKLQSLDEVVQLMQMGANYTKKLQALQPNLKMVKMLENNDLMDEKKLAFLIDLDKKNPEAIKKLLSDSKIDPLDIDTSEEPNYVPSNYGVSDEAMAFDSALADVASSEKGKEVIVMIDKEWDIASKEAIYKDPSVLRIISEQKQNGLYDRISEEVERQKVLGHLQGIPFINAYYQVGTAMQNQGLLTTSVPENQNGPASAVTQAPTRVSKVVETRAAPRKPTNNTDKAKAAAMVKTAKSTPASQDFNPLAMSDEEFEKHAELAKRL